MSQSIRQLTLKENDDFYKLLRAFYFFIHSRTQTLFLLVQNDCLWDAEIIIRPIFECTVKFAYISSFDEMERIEKIREFWEDLAEINQLKQSKQAKLVVDLTNIESSFLNDMILNDDENLRLSTKWTKSIRQRKEQPWSYNEMIKTISNKEDFKEIEILVRNFTQSSHLIHADETAIGIIFDRENRTEEQKEALMDLHEIRLLSDCVFMFCWIAKISANLSKIDIDGQLKKKLDQFENCKLEFKSLEEIIK